LEHGARMPTGEIEKICPSATLFTSNPNELGTREILRCANSRLGQGTTPDFTDVNIDYLSMT